MFKGHHEHNRNLLIEYWLKHINNPVLTLEHTLGPAVYYCTRRFLKSDLSCGYNEVISLPPVVFVFVLSETDIFASESGEGPTDLINRWVFQFRTTVCTCKYCVYSLINLLLIRKSHNSTDLKGTAIFT